MSSLIRVGLYLGIGAILHAFVIGPHFDWSSAWTFAWLFAWPIMLIIWFWIISITIGVVALLVIGALAAMGRF